MMALNGSIPIKSRKETANVNLDDVLFISKQLRKVIVHTCERQYEYYSKMSEVPEHLDDRFFKCHYSLYINLEKVRSMRDNTIYFNTGKSVLIGTTNFFKTKKAYFKYIQTGINIDTYS